jgi:hypothetical protein
MEIRPQAACGYSDWEVFESREPMNLWSYTRLFLQQRGFAYRLEDLSFAVVESGQVIGICPVFLTKIGEELSFSDDGGYLRAPLVSASLNSRAQSRVLTAMMSHLDELAVKKHVGKAMFLIEPQPAQPSIAHNFLTAYGYLDTSIATQILDLQKTEEALKSELRKSYTPIINKGLRTYEFAVYDKKNPDFEVHETYRRTHFKAAGRETSPKFTFDLQFEQLKRGESVLITASFTGKPVQLDYFQTYNGHVYYGSAADDPEFSDSAEVPLGHAIIWRAIQHFKSQGFRHFEIGWQESVQPFSRPSPKELKIAFFKRGFGGSSYPLFRGIKHYDLALMEREMRDAYQSFIERLKQNRESKQ